MIEEKKKEIKPLTAEDQLYVKELVWQLNGTIRRVVRSYLDDDLSAEFDDVVQSIFETICKQLDDFRNADSPEALAVRIASRRVWHVRRDWKATEELSEDYAATDDGPRGLDDILPKSFPPSDKALLNSVYVHQESMVDLASDLGCSPAKLRQQLKRARDRLKKFIEK